MLCRADTRGVRTVLALVLVALGCAGCRARPLEVPDPLTVAPSVPVFTARSPASRPTCGLLDPGSGGSVSNDPIDVRAAWLPGLGWHPCRSVLVRGTEAQAVRLAHDIDQLPSWPGGPMSCPSDDGAAVELVFAYRGHRYEQVVVQLSGCAGVAGGGQLTDALRADLRPLAPTAWQPYLQP